MVLDKVENIENIKSEGEGKGKDEQFGKKNQQFQCHQKVITGETKTKYKKNENQGNNASTGEEDKNNKNTIKTNKPETIFSKLNQKTLEKATKIANEEKMTTFNTIIENCKGVWTRVQEERKLQLIMI